MSDGTEIEQADKAAAELLAKYGPKGPSRKIADIKVLEQENERLRRAEQIQLSVNVALAAERDALHSTMERLREDVESWRCEEITAYELGARVMQALAGKDGGPTR